jgi:hypothetical protein
MFRVLLLGGVIAGPIYVIVAGIQVATRDGFDITRHPVSLLSLGDWGWVQIGNFVIVGLLVLGAAIALWQVVTSGRASKWGPLLIGMYGIGLILSGVFVADAMDGFPPGTPAGDSAEASFSGIMHLMAGGIAFLSLVGASLVFARRFNSLGQRGWSAFSIMVGALILAGFALIGIFPGEAFSNLLLTAAVVSGWVWLSLLSWTHLPPEGARSMTPAAAGTD